MERKWKWDEITGVFLFALGAGMLLVSVFLSFSSDIWYDELYTMGLACSPWGGWFPLRRGMYIPRFIISL